MAKKRKHVAVSDSDSLSEDVEDGADISDPFIRPKILKTLHFSDSDWIVKYAPVNSADVCVNPRKLKEVKDILLQMVSGELNCRLLVVTGPSGCSKSTLIRCLGNELIAIRKGKKPTSGKVEQNDHVIEYLDTQLDSVLHKLHFSDFLDECRYRVGQNLALVLVEELPNIFHRKTLANFQLSIRNWVYSQAHLPPLVICLTEVEIESDSPKSSYYTLENNVTAETVLGREFLLQGELDGLVKRCQFLPIAKTFMKKTLQSILSKEHIKPSIIQSKQKEQILTALYETGDVRSLIGTLQFWLRHSDDGFDVASMMRQLHLLLFHAVGKVIHSSTKYATLDDDLADYYLIENVVENYNNFGLLQLGLLENYHIYNGLHYDVSVAADLVNALSLCDTFSTLEAPQYGIRAVRNLLRSVEATPGRTLQMKFPRHFKMVRAANQVGREISDYSKYLGNLQVSFNDINLVDGFYVPTIYNSFRYKLRHGNKSHTYNRVGGRFQAIVADDAIPVMESTDERDRGVRDQFRIDIEAKMGHGSHSDDEDAMSEPIEDSQTDDDDHDFDDSLDENILSMSSAHKNIAKVNTHSRLSKERKNMESNNGNNSGNSTNSNSNDGSYATNYGDDWSDDPELDWLVSQGKI